MVEREGEGTSFHLPKSATEFLYSRVYLIYQGGHYSKALYLFRLFAYLVPCEPRFFLGLAACYHRLKDYRQGAFFYAQASALDPSNPMPEYYASDCWINLSSPEKAALCLEQAIKRSQGRPAFNEIFERSLLSLRQLVKPAS